jgi:cell division protein FtsQ
MKHILTISFTLLLLAGMFVLLGFIRQEHSHAYCNSIKVSIEYTSTDTLVCKDEIRNLLISEFDTLEGKALTVSNLARIRNSITSIVYIEDCDVDFLLNGDLRIRAKQRIPILRLNTGGQTWFIDDQGMVMPRHPYYSAMVPVASGHLTHTSMLKPGNDLRALADTNKVFATSMLNQLIKVAHHVYHDDNLKGLIEQIYVNPDGEIELYTYVGSHRILFGKADNLAHKFNNLLQFYRSAPSATGLSQYKTINLKYSGQVVCSKS